MSYIFIVVFSLPVFMVQHLAKPISEKWPAALVKQAPRYQINKAFTKKLYYLALILEWHAKVCEPLAESVKILIILTK